MRLQLLAFLAAVSVIAVHASDPGCLDPQGKSVDWFIALKLPNGTYYAYCDSVACTNLTNTGNQLNTYEQSPVLRTLGQLSNLTSNTTGSLFWNDQPPNNITASPTTAHAKGFIGFSQQKGFLMVHSTPLFPQINNITQIVNLTIDTSQQKFGQHFFCISASTDSLNSIAAGYNIDWPKVYGGQIPSSFTGVQNLQGMLSNTRNVTVQKLVVPFSSLKGQKFLKMSKSGKWEVPLYENVVAIELAASLLIESWGSPQENPSCTLEYPVMSNPTVQLGNVKYNYTLDHSKYGISLDTKIPYVCLGDINRQSSQWKRGGGTVCFEDDNVYNLFRQAMQIKSQCASTVSASSA